MNAYHLRAGVFTPALPALLCLAFLLLLSPMLVYAAPQSVGRVAQVDVLDLGNTQQFLFTAEGGERCEVIPYAADVIRVRCHWSTLLEQDDIGIAKTLSSWPSVTLNVVAEDSHYRIQTELLEVEVVMDPQLQINFLDRDGNPLSQGRGISFDSAYSPLNDSTYQLTKAHNDIATGYQVRNERAMPAGESYFGMGEHAGSLNLRGQVLQGWNSDAFMWKPEKNPMYMTLPFFYGVSTTTNHAWGLFFNNPVRPTVFFGKERVVASGERSDLADSDSIALEAGAGLLDYFFFGGGEDHQMPQVLQRYAELTGLPPLWPKWAYGYHMSRWSYTQDQIEELVDRFRAEQIPVDAVYMDIDYMDQTPHTGFTNGEYYDNQLIQLTTNDVFVPEPSRLFSHADSNNYQLVPLIEAWLTIEDPKFSFAESNDYFIEDNQGNNVVTELFFGNASWLDFTDPQAVNWWDGQVRNFLNQYPFDGIWNDLNEPADWRDTIGESTPLPLDGLMSHGGRFGDDPTDPRNWFLSAKNTYALHETKATYQTLLDAKPLTRPFVLSRSGWPGIQRYAFNWSGDNTNEGHSTPYVNAVADNIRVGLNTMISGQVNFGHDVGGFVGEPTGESLARWTEWTALMPFFRNHSAKWGGRREPYLYSETNKQHMVDSIRFRYQLMPFLYSLVYASTQTGVPMNAPKVFYFQDDPTTHLASSDHDFMVGSHLLAAPLIDLSASQRQVYLPAGQVWYDWHDDARYDGGQFVSVDAPLGRLPLFVREGAIIPMGPTMNYVDELPGAPLSIHAWPGSGEFLLYEDDGKTLNYQSGQYRQTRFTQRQISSEWQMDILVDGSYSPGRTSLTVIKHIASVPSSVTLDGSELAGAANLSALSAVEQGYFFDADTETLHIKLQEKQGLQQLAVLEEGAQGLVTLYYRTDWTTPSMIYSADGSEWLAEPGESLIESGFSGYYTISIPASQLTFAITDGAGNWDSRQGANYSIIEPGTYTLKDGVINQGVPPSHIELQYRTSWDVTTIHYSANGGAWQQATMNAGSLNGFVDFSLEAVSLEFYFSDGTQVDDQQGANYQIASPGQYYVDNEQLRSGQPEQVVRLFVEADWPQAFISYTTDGTNWTAEPVAMTPSAIPGYFQFDIQGQVAVFSVTDGAGQWLDNGGQHYSVSQLGSYTLSVSGLENSAPTAQITLYYQTAWSTPHILYSADQGVWVDQPGASMPISDIGGYASITIDASRLEFVLNDGADNWDNNQFNNYLIEQPGVFTLADGVIIPGLPGTQITLYIKSNWDSMNILYQLDEQP